MILTDLICRFEFDIEIIAVDTGRPHKETYELADQVVQRYEPVIQTVYPEQEQIEAWCAQHGRNAFYDSIRRRHECCDIRKVQPLKRALAGKRPG